MKLEIGNFGPQRRFPVTTLSKATSVSATASPALSGRYPLQYKIRLPGQVSIKEHHKEFQLPLIFKNKMKTI